MTHETIYRDIAARTDGAVMLGVVGPVRTGKSTFIKQFMETLVIPQIENTYMRERARDELPQSGSGRTIMTAEPKFVPEEAVSITLAENTRISVRLADCVGYMVEGAAGQFENGEERLVTTPWYDREITISEAAEKGTHKVITEHSTIGIVVTTDGSICDIPRESYVRAEERTVAELKEIGKPFVLLLNTRYPSSPEATALAGELEEKYGVSCLPVSCAELDEEGICAILKIALDEFPLECVQITFPEWMDALPENSELKSSVYKTLLASCEGLDRMRDCTSFTNGVCASELVEKAAVERTDHGTGTVSVSVKLPRSLYYDTISRQSGLDIRNDADLINMLTGLSEVRRDYETLRSALESARQTGYGLVMPDPSQMKLEQPQIVRQGGKYTVKLRASAPAMHIIMTNVETEVMPAIGGESASDDIIGFLLQGFDGDVNKIWQSNIFGRSLNDIAEEGLASKLSSLPENAKMRLRDTLQRIINEGSTGLICILL